MIPPQQKISSSEGSTTFRALELVPSAVLHFKWESGKPTTGSLKPDVYASKQMEQEPTLVPVPVNQEELASLKQKEELEARWKEEQIKNKSSKSNQSTSNSKQPKWLKK